MTTKKGKLNMYFVVAVFIITYTGDVGAHLCSAITSIDCRHPSLNARLCFCRCLDAKINREYLEVTFSPCEKLFQKCHFYKLGFEISFIDEEDHFIGSIEVYINHKMKNRSEIFPLYELTDSLNHKLKLDKRYTVSIQPRCTSCDDFCEFLQDMEIPPAVVTSPISIENVEPSKWLYVAVVMSVFVVIMVAVGALILVCRHLKTHQESPLNNRNIQYSNVGKDVENNPLIYSVDQNDMPFTRQIKITSEQEKPESNLHKSTKTINIISLNTDKTFIEELSTFIPTNVFKFKILDPADIVVKTPTEYSFKDQMLENKINLVVLNNSVVRDLLGNSDTNGSITNLWLILINRITTDKDLYLLTYFMSFENDFELLIINFDTFNIFKSILQKFVDLSGTRKEMINKFDNFLNRIGSRPESVSI